MIREIKDIIDYPCQLRLIEARKELGKDTDMGAGLDIVADIKMLADVNICQVHCPLVDRGSRLKYLAGVETQHDKVATLISLTCSGCEYRRGLEDVKHGRREYK